MSNKEKNNSQEASTKVNTSYCICKKCGEIVPVDTSMALLSDPPKYNYHCPHCNNSGYAYSNELFSYIITTDAQYGSNPTVPIIETAPCLICGEPVPVSMWENHAKICDKCKKAILKVRKMFEEEY